MDGDGRSPPWTDPWPTDPGGDPALPGDAPYSPEVLEEVRFLERPEGAELRLATYNIWKNSIFEDAEFQERFARVVRAVDADVWALQEVWQPTGEVAALFDELLPLADGAGWQAVYAGARVTVSRFPIVLHHWETEPNCGTKTGLHLIDLPDEHFEVDLYVVHPHFTPFEGPAEDAARQCQADQIVSWLRRAVEPDGAVRLPHGTPIVIAGDLNMVGSLEPLRTLLEGDIADEETFGPGHSPDWDGTAMVDAEPLHNGVGPDTWTWRSDRSRWGPGRLDFIIYTDSVANMVNSFVLNTVALSAEALEAAGLGRLDVVLQSYGNGAYAFDHIPVVADFTFVSLELDD